MDASEVPSNITQILRRYRAGDRGALDELLPQVYKELRRLAGAYMRRESPHHTLQATALVHEAYFRLVDQNEVRWENRAHFFGIAAQMMRRILVDHARSRHAGKRGGKATKISFEEGLHFSLDRDVALKVSRRSGDEARTMAPLEHDNIVKIFSRLSIPRCNIGCCACSSCPGSRFSGLFRSCPTLPRTVTFRERGC